MRSDNLRPLSGASIALLEGLGLQVERVAIDLAPVPRATADILQFTLQDRFERARQLLAVEGADVAAIAMVTNLTEPQIKSIRQHMRGRER